MKKISSILFLILLVTGCSASSEKDLGEEELLTESMNLYSRELYTTAKDKFLKFQTSYPASSYVNLAELKIADCEFFAGDYAKSVTTYQGFIQSHPKSEAAEYAQFQIASAYQLMHKSTSTDQTPSVKAIEHYQLLIDTYPNSVYSKQAVDSITEIREKLATHEIEVAEFYAKQKQFAAARHRLEIVMNQFADTKAAYESAPMIADKYKIEIARKRVKPIDKLEQLKSRKAFNYAQVLQGVIHSSKK